MEIKHTVEILTKDIQEIEKLVRNLNNSPAPPRIELDLALSKLRNVYELLSMIREDAEHAVRIIKVLTLFQDWFRAKEYSLKRESMLRELFDNAEIRDFLGVNRFA